MNRVVMALLIALLAFILLSPVCGMGECLVR